VKIHHPDTGGDAATFRKINQAYEEELAHWEENPIFTRLRGFPDKWFYDASTNRWSSPHDQAVNRMDWDQETNTFSYPIREGLQQ
jgi:hypothetical protein